MKIQLDTDSKVIRLENRVNLGEFMRVVKSLLPRWWQEFELEAVTKIEGWTCPIIIEKYRERPYPWYEPTVTWKSDTNIKASDYSNGKLIGGQFNVSC